jgi:hypothetical protein
MKSAQPRVEYRARAGVSSTRVARFEDGKQVGPPVFAGAHSVAMKLAQELNVAVATGVRLASEHSFDRDVVISAVKEFDWADYRLNDAADTLEAGPDAQEWVGDLANAVIAALARQQ